MIVRTKWGHHFCHFAVIILKLDYYTKYGILGLNKKRLNN